jgi:hypothetical protein
MIAVLPPDNQTGNPLFVSGVSSLDWSAFDAEPVTVGDLLAREARSQLTERGFRVTSGGRASSRSLEPLRRAACTHAPRRSCAECPVYT